MGFHWNMRFTFRDHERLRRPADFLRTRRRGRKRVGRCLVVWCCRREESPPRAARLGVMVGRKNGTAVQRNRFKRRLREIFRLHKHRLERGWDILAAPRADASGSGGFPPPYGDLCADFLEITRPLHIHDPSRPRDPN